MDITSKGKNIALAAITLIACLSQFGAGIYTPAMPVIADDLNTHLNLVQFSLAIYLFGVAISLLIYGAVSEGIGRIRPLLVGLFIMAIGTAICMHSQHIHTLILGRLIQGLGAGASAGLWRAIFYDIFQGKDMTKWGGYLGTIWVFVIPMAPMFGASLLYLIGWKAIFGFIIVYIIAIYTVLFTLFTETNQHCNPKRLKLSFICKHYKRCLSHHHFIVMTLCTFLTYGAFFSWFVISPSLLIKHMGLSPASYGMINLLIAGITSASASWLHGKKIAHLGTTTILRIGWGLMTLSGIMIWLSNMIFGPELLSLLAATCVFFFGSTLIWPNAFSIAMKPFKKTAGYAGSIYSFMQLIGGAIIGSILAHHHDTNAMVLATCFSLSGIVSLGLYETLIRAPDKRAT